MMKINIYLCINEVYTLNFKDKLCREFYEGDTDYKIILKMKIRICYIHIDTFSFLSFSVQYQLWSVL